MEKVAVISEVLFIIMFCIIYYCLFGKVRTSKKAKIAEIISLYGTVVIFASAAKGARVWMLFIAFALIGTMKKITAKNEDRRKGHID